MDDPLSSSHVNKDHMKPELAAVALNATTENFGEMPTDAEAVHSVIEMFTRTTNSWVKADGYDFTAAAISKYL